MNMIKLYKLTLWLVVPSLEFALLSIHIYILSSAEGHDSYFRSVIYSKN